MLNSTSYAVSTVLQNSKNITVVIEETLGFKLPSVIKWRTILLLG